MPAVCKRCRVFTLFLLKIRAAFQARFYRIFFAIIDFAGSQAATKAHKSWLWLPRGRTRDLSVAARRRSTEVPPARFDLRAEAEG